MPEIHVVQRGNRHLYENYFDPYFRLRHDIYVKQRKWMALDRPDVVRNRETVGSDPCFCRAAPSQMC